MLARLEVVIATYEDLRENGFGLGLPLENVVQVLELPLVNGVLVDGLGLPAGIGVTAASEEARSGTRSS